MLASDVTNEDLDTIISSGLRVPDHGALSPWKIIVFKGKSRETFGKLFLGKRFKELNPSASEDDIFYEENRFLRAGVVVCIVSSPVPHEKIPIWEMQLSSAAVCQNILLCAQSLGYAAQWLTEWYSYDEAITQELTNNDNDRISGFIYIGKKEHEPKERIRPDLLKVVSYWEKF
tara:strand:+ start:145 stop:666 length:522 start_codon:yes stop_codon:yes gene_type:complete